MNRTFLLFTALIMGCHLTDDAAEPVPEPPKHECAFKGGALPGFDKHGRLGRTAYAYDCDDGVPVWLEIEPPPRGVTIETRTAVLRNDVP